MECSVRIHVGVGQRCRASDVESPAALPAASARSASIEGMEKTSQKVQNASSHPIQLRTHKAHGQFSGAMEEMSGKVQNASTHRLGRINHEHVHSSRSVQGSQFKGAMD